MSKNLSFGFCWRFGQSRHYSIMSDASRSGIDILLPIFGTRSHNVSLSFRVKASFPLFTFNVFFLQEYCFPRSPGLMHFIFLLIWNFLPIIRRECTGVLITSISYPARALSLFFAACLVKISCQTLRTWYFCCNFFLFFRLEKGIINFTRFS